MTEPDKTWEEWIRLVADEYGLNLDKKIRKQKNRNGFWKQPCIFFRNGDLKEPPPMPSPKSRGGGGDDFQALPLQERIASASGDPRHLPGGHTLPAASGSEDHGSGEAWRS